MTAPVEHQVHVTIRVKTGSSDTTQAVSTWSPQLAHGFDEALKSISACVRPGLVAQDDLRQQDG